MSERPLNIDIKNYLPHLKPMLMVDGIEHICIERVLTHFTIKNDCIFIDNNHLSEAGLIENAAQTCSSISGQYYFDQEPSAESQNNPDLIGFISSIKKINIHKLPQVGVTIQTKAHLISQVQMPDYAICTLKVTIFGTDIVFLEGEMNLFLQRK